MDQLVVSYQAPGPDAEADLLARQPHGEDGEGPGDEGGRRGGHHAGGVPLADVAQAGERGGDADDARDEREHDEEPRRQVADREVDREQPHRRRHAHHCTNTHITSAIHISCCLCARRGAATSKNKYTLTRVPALVDAVVDGPAGDGRDDDVHDEVEEQEGGRHGPVGGGRHAASLSLADRHRPEGKLSCWDRVSAVRARAGAAVALWFLLCVKASARRVYMRVLPCSKERIRLRGY